MTVAELIKLLSEVKDQNREVVQSSDGEQSSVSPTDSIETGSYDAYNTWSGEFGIEELTEELIDQGYTDEDVMPGVPALILNPTN